MPPASSSPLLPSLLTLSIIRTLRSRDSSPSPPPFLAASVYTRAAAEGSFCTSSKNLP